MEGLVREEAGRGMSREGLAKRASTSEERGVRGRARFLIGRRERGSEDVGMDSGIGSDIVAVVVVVVKEECRRCGCRVGDGAQ